MYVCTRVEESARRLLSGKAPYGSVVTRIVSRAGTRVNQHYQGMPVRD